MPISRARIMPATRTPLARGLAVVLAAAAALTSLAEVARGQEITRSHGYSTFGDLGYGPDFKHLSYVNPDAPRGGEMSFAWLGTFDTMNPYTQKGRAGILATIGYEDMMSPTADEIGTIYCLVCETLEYPEDRAWVIFNMRPEAAFSDGTPITADDILFTYEMFLEEGLISFRTVLAQFVQGVEVLGPHQVKYTFKPESPVRDRVAMAGGMPVMSKTWFEETGAGLDESRMDPGVGSGPYLLDSFDVNQRIVYRRNPDYWGRDLPINIGRANFETIRIEYFGDSNAALEGFKSGAYTFRNENSSKNWATSYDFPALTEGHVVKAELPDGTIATGQSFAMNMRREKFQDVRVRQAIGLMFNFEWSNQTLFYGLYERINSFWENSELAAEGVPSEAEAAILQPLVDDGLVDAALLTEPAVMAPTSGDRQLDRGNLRKASALLDAAGWPVGDDGLRRNDAGQTLQIEILEDDPTFERVITPYVENLRRLGLDARLNRVDPAQYTNLTRAHEFDMIVDQFPTGYEPGSGLKQYFGCDGVEDVFNSPGLCDPAVDRLIEVVLAADSREALHVAVKALDRVLRAKYFWVPQWYKDTHTVAYYDLYRYPQNLPPFDLGYLDFWWWDADRAAALVAAGALRR